MNPFLGNPRAALVPISPALGLREQTDKILRLLQQPSPVPVGGTFSTSAASREVERDSLPPDRAPSVVPSAGEAHGTSVRRSPVTADLPFPAPRNDDERIENAMWLIENNPSGRALGSSPVREPFPSEHFEPTIKIEQSASSFGIGNLFGLIGTAEAQPRNRGGRFDRTPIEAARVQWHGLMLRRLEQLEPRNPYLTTISPPNYIPSPQNMNDLAREVREAEARIVAGLPPRPPGNLGPLPASRGGESESTIAGRAAGREIYDQLRPQGYGREYPLLGGTLRADAVRLNTRDSDLVEIKSNAPRAIQRAERQLERYKRALEEETKMPVNSRIETYDIQEMIRRILGLSE